MFFLLFRWNKYTILCPGHLREYKRTMHMLEQSHCLPQFKELNQLRISTVFGTFYVPQNLIILTIKSPNFNLSCFQILKLLKTLTVFRFHSMTLYGKVHDNLEPRYTDHIIWNFCGYSKFAKFNPGCWAPQQKGQSEYAVHL